MATYTEKECPDLNSYPAGTYHFKVVEAKHSSLEEPLLITVQFSVISSTAEGVSAGAKYTERFRLGTEDDPQAEAPDTKRDFKKAGMGWAHWLDLTKKTGVHCGDTEEEVSALNASKPEVVADMDRREGKKDGKPTGSFFNGLARYYEPGKKDAGTAVKSPSKPATKATSPSGSKPSGSKMVKCEVCEPAKMIPEKLYPAHVKRHELEAAEAGGEEQ